MTTEQTPAALAAETKRLAHQYHLSAVWDIRANETREALHAAIDRLEALASAAQPLRCEGCGKTMREHDALLHCPPTAAQGEPVASVSRSNDLEGLVQWAGKRLPVSTLLYTAPVAAAEQPAPADTMTLQEVWDLAGGAHSVERPSRHYVEMLLRELDAQKAIPEGWKVVPRDPTGEMLDAACLADNEAFGGRSNGADIADIWAAMWNAAPPAPAQTSKAKP